MRDLDPADRDTLRRVLLRFGMADAEVTRLEGGSRNRCYRLNDESHDLVARIAGQHDAEFAVAREAEAMAQRLAAAYGLAPQVLLEDHALGIMVTEFAPGSTCSREWARSEQGAARAGAWFGRLHAIDVPPAMRRVDFGQSLENYCSQIGHASETGWLLRTGRQVTQQFGHQPLALCHNDLHHQNLIDGGDRLLGIDWEYAGAGEAVMDLAGFVAYHDLEPGALQSLLDGYGAMHPAISAKEIVPARWLFEAVWWAWLELRHLLEPDEPPDFEVARVRLRDRLASAQSDS